MARQADQPGSYRVRQTPLGWRVQGLMRNGEKVKRTFLTEIEAQSWAGTTFDGKSPIAITRNEWGVPIEALKMSPESVSSLNAAFGIPTIGAIPSPPPTTTAPVIQSLEEKKKKTEHAQSLMELFGIGWAAGTVMVGRKITENIGNEVVNPDPKQVRDLRDSFKDTVTTWFGDKEIKPWQMTVLLSIGIPLTMVIQSKKKKPEENKANLKSVP
jgi:hypothetical protein